MSKALNKFKLYASLGTTVKSKPTPVPQPSNTSRGGETQMQKVASMLMHIIERKKSSLPGYQRGLPEKLTKEIRESFDIIDTDSDGLVRRDQIEDLVYRIDPEMSEKEMVDLLETADLDGDGMYDMDEYVFLMYLKWNDQESVDDIKEAFMVFDKDNNGKLNKDEFSFILGKLGEPLTEFEVDEILRYFDKDGNGEIDFDEFAYVMTGPHINDDGGVDDLGIPHSRGLPSFGKPKPQPVKRAIDSPLTRLRRSKNLATLSELTLSEEETKCLHEEEWLPQSHRMTVNVDVERTRDDPEMEKKALMRGFSDIYARQTIDRDADSDSLSYMSFDSDNDSIISNFARNIKL